ncbi:MAG: mercuric reductase [Acidobacteriota bacterium]|nr:mercuric reductase [Acidobacteriota bacterium]
MPTTKSDHVYDILIIGGGQAGVPLAHALAVKGSRVALAERKELGGSCVNFGCTPTKSVIASAKVAHLARRGNEFGLTIPRVDVDFPRVLARARGIVTQSRVALRKGFAETSNPKLLRGHARFLGKKRHLFELRVGDLDVTARQVVLDTGTRSRIPEVEGLDCVQYLEAGNWLQHAELPDHLAVIGGSYTGLEMAQFYRRMGSRVTVIEEGDRITAREDRDVAAAIQQFLESEEIAFRLNTSLHRVARGRDLLRLTLREGTKSSTLFASHLFIAAGRKPNTDDLGLERVGVKVGPEGIVVTDKRLATNVRGIWAAGDIRGGPMFTHTAWDDYRILSSQIGGDRSRTTDRIVPYAVYTDPQLGRAGMTEEEARQTGRRIRIGRFEMKKNGKAKEIGEPEGFVKVIVDARTRRILGAAVLSAEGAELIHLFIEIMNAKAPCTVIEEAIHIHPTLAEAVQSAVAAVE